MLEQLCVGKPAQKHQAQKGPKVVEFLHSRCDGQVKRATPSAGKASVPCGGKDDHPKK